MSDKILSEQEKESFYQEFKKRILNDVLVDSQGTGNYGKLVDNAEKKRQYGFGKFKNDDVVGD